MVYFWFILLVRAWFVYFNYEDESILCKFPFLLYLQVEYGKIQLCKTFQNFSASQTQTQSPYLLHLHQVTGALKLNWHSRGPINVSALFLTDLLRAEACWETSAGNVSVKPPRLFNEPGLQRGLQGHLSTFRYAFEISEGGKYCSFQPPL